MANTELQNGMLLKHSEYCIERTLGQGGFGITYKAEQISLGRKVAIKEFFMKKLCERDEGTSHVTLGSAGSREIVNRFREKFLKEARNIAKLNHPNIVRIIDVFEENGTAYYVMEYAENGSLADKVKREGYLSESVATRYILQVAEALDYVHQHKMNHLDVKPANIMLNEKDESVLIDFGLSKQYDATTGSQTSSTPVGISEGYAPMEQYKQGGVGMFSPETDIYALGATFFKLLTGMTPPSASDVNEDGLPIEKLRAKGISEKAISVIRKAMEPRKKNRMKDVRTFIDELKATNKPKKDPKSKTSGSDISKWMFYIFNQVVFGVFGIYLFYYGSLQYWEMSSDVENIANGHWGLLLRVVVFIICEVFLCFISISTIAIPMYCLEDEKRKIKIFIISLLSILIIIGLCFGT